MSKVLDIEPVSTIFYIMSSKPVIAEEPGNSLTYREKSLWVTVVSTLAIYAFYFWRVLEIGDGDPGRVAGVFVATVIAMIAANIVVHAALAIHRRPEGVDERDRQVALRGTRISYYVLMSGVWGALGVATLSLGTFWVAHAALLAIVIAELVRCGSQLIYYRRGI